MSEPTGGTFTLRCEGAFITMPFDIGEEEAHNALDEVYELAKGRDLMRSQFDLRPIPFPI